MAQKRDIFVHCLPPMLIFFEDSNDFKPDVEDCAELGKDSDDLGRILMGVLIRDMNFVRVLAYSGDFGLVYLDSIGFMWI